MKFHDEVKDIKFEILNDFMGNVVLEDGSYKPWRSAFPEVKSVNHHSGYITMKDGTIRCSLGCNMHIAQYEGCQESSINPYSHTY